MGKTLVILKVNPKDMERLEEAEAEIRAIKSGDVKDVKRAGIGFGITVLKVGILIEEKEEGALDRMTNEVEKLSNVESVEVEGMTLV